MKCLITILLPMFILGWTTISFAQNLTVTSVTPKDGSISVDTSITISMEFNKELIPMNSKPLADEKGAILPPSEGSTIENYVTLWPKAKKMSNLKISGNSLSVNVLLDANTCYQIVLLGSMVYGVDRSNPGKALTMVSTFTTGTKFPTASISGKLTPLHPLSTHQAVVTLSRFGDKFENPYRGVEVKSDSTFIISPIEPGTYRLMAKQFMYISLYDAVSESFPTEITVKEGDVLVDKNIAITPLRVISSVPKDSSVNVDTSTTISVTFSEPLKLDNIYYLDADGKRVNDITIDSLNPGSYYPSIGTTIFPSPLNEGVKTLSEDRKTISFPVLLNSNTFYKLTLHHGVSENNKYLNEPVEIFFSTGPTIPSGSISGLITNYTESGGEKIIIKILNESGKLIETAVANNTGSYRFTHMRDGSYYVSASASKYDNSTGLQEYIAYYGWDGAGDDTPNTVIIKNGEAVTGIDMTLGTSFVLKLLSTAPKDGDVNVPTENASLSFTFNLPLTVMPNLLIDTNVIDESIQRMFIMNIAPLPNFLKTMRISNFGRTVTFNGALAKDTYYTVLLEGVGEIFGYKDNQNFFKFLNPTAFGFSTGSALPTTSISGTITLPNKNANYVAVRLFSTRPDPVFPDGTRKPYASYVKDTYINGKGEIVSKDSTVTDSSNGENPDILVRPIIVSGLGLVDINTGNYSVRVPSGTYWLSAYADFPPGNSKIETYKYYDPNGDGRADSIVVQNESRTNIDVSFEIIDTMLLTGMITDQRRRPVVKARVRLYSEKWSAETTTDPYGIYQFQKIPAGDYTIEINPPEEIDLQSEKMPVRLGDELYVKIHFTLMYTKPHYTVSRTKTSYPIFIDYVDFYGGNYPKGDEIAVKLESGKIVGMVSFPDSFPVILDAWADDPATSEKDGFAVGDSMYFELYNFWLDREITAFATYGEGDGKFGAEQQSHLKLNVRVLKSDTIVVLPINKLEVPIKSVYENNSSIEVRFQSGNVTGANVSMKNLGNTPPDNIQSVNTLRNVVAFFIVEAKDLDTFTARISFGYTDSLLTAAGISEENLVIAYYDSAKAKWHALPTEIDKTKKVATAITNHFSLWMLTDKNNSEIISNVDEHTENNSIPSEFKLHQNYPNPFNPTTIIRYELKQASFVTLTVYNLLGQRVRTLVHSEMPAGSYDVMWDARSDSGAPVASGIYLYRIKAGNFSEIKKMVLIR